jgi:hypothetical protein
LQPRYFALDRISNVCYGAVNGHPHLRVFGLRAHLTKRMKCDGDITGGCGGLRAGCTGLKSHDDKSDVSA